MAAPHAAWFMLLLLASASTATVPPASADDHEIDDLVDDVMTDLDRVPHAITAGRGNNDCDRRADASRATPMHLDFPATCDFTIADEDNEGDWFRFTVVETSVLAFAVKNRDDDGTCMWCESVWLWDEDGAQPAATYAAHVNHRYERHFHHVVPAGTYDVEIIQYGGNDGHVDYHLDARLDPWAPSDDCGAGDTTPSHYLATDPPRSLGSLPTPCTGSKDRGDPYDDYSLDLDPAVMNILEVQGTGGTDRLGFRLKTPGGLMDEAAAERIGPDHWRLPITDANLGPSTLLLGEDLPHVSRAGYRLSLTTAPIPSQEDCGTAGDRPRLPTGARPFLSMGVPCSGELPAGDMGDGYRLDLANLSGPAVLRVTTDADRPLSLEVLLDGVREATTTGWRTTTTNLFYVDGATDGTLRVRTAGWNGQATNNSYTLRAVLEPTTPNDCGFGDDAPDGVVALSEHDGFDLTDRLLPDAIFSCQGRTLPFDRTDAFQIGPTKQDYVARVTDTSTGDSRFSVFLHEPGNTTASSYAKNDGLVKKVIPAGTAWYMLIGGTGSYQLELLPAYLVIPGDDCGSGHDAAWQRPVSMGLDQTCVGQFAHSNAIGLHPIYDEVEYYAVDLQVGDVVYTMYGQGHAIPGGVPNGIRDAIYPDGTRADDLAGIAAPGRYNGVFVAHQTGTWLFELGRSAASFGGKVDYTFQVKVLRAGTGVGA